MEKNVKPYIAELIGTFALVFLSAGSVCAMQFYAPGQSQGALIGTALASGFALAAFLAATLPLSGGYLNPAITIVLWVFKRLDGAMTAGFIFVQMLGGVLAGGLVRLLFAAREDVMRDTRLGAPHLTLKAFGVSGINFSALMVGIALETVLTFLLTFVIFGTMIDPRAPRVLGRAGKWLGSLWVGLAFSAITLVGFGLTGAATNTARWFGPVAWEMTVPSLQSQHPFADMGVYLIGPILGALLAGGIYTTLILPAGNEIIDVPTPAIRGTKSTTTVRHTRTKA